MLAQQATVTTDPFAFFHPQISISADERSKLARGEPIVKSLPPSAREVAIFSATTADFSGDRLVAWMRRVDELKKSSYVPAIGLFSTAPRIEDLESLELDDADLDELKDCRPGACGLKLSESEIPLLASVATSRRAGWQAEAQQAFRQIVLARAVDYLKHGLAGAPPYRDRDDPVGLDAEFQQLLGNTGFLTTRLPSLTQFLQRFPDSPDPDVESLLYWSKERLGGRPIISITHVAISRHTGGHLPEVVVVSRQVFGTHYVTGSLALTALVGGHDGAPHYLVYLNRSKVDLLDGWLGGFVRRAMERRLRNEAGDVVEGLRRRLAAGEPPA